MNSEKVVTPLKRFILVEECPEGWKSFKANALWLSDPVKLDERCSLDARTPARKKRKPLRRTIIWVRYNLK